MDRLLEPNNEQPMHCNWEQPKEDNNIKKTKCKDTQNMVIKLSFKSWIIRPISKSWINLYYESYFVRYIAN
jgi:hypothetical protein